MNEEYFNSADHETDASINMFDLSIDDGRLVQMIGQSLADSIDSWNKPPYNLEQADKSNLKYWLGDQMTDRYISAGGDAMPNMGNRLQTSSRAVLAYVNSRVANPEVAPSTSDQLARQFAKDVSSAMYQHGVDHNLKPKAKKATQNLVIQKRGWLKLRFDPTCGPFGDIEVEHINPEDIVIEYETSAYGVEPRKVWHRQTCSVEELISKFPKKEEAIYSAYGWKGRGVYSQLSKMATYWECWFTYFEDGVRKEGLAWYMPRGKVVLAKMPNPNFIYTGDDQKDRETNYSAYPIKPFVVLNYMNSGKKAIDETSLFEQGKVLQDIYNKRKKQIMENNDYINGRMIMDSGAVQEGDANKFFSKNPKAILLIKPAQGQSVSTSVHHVPHNPLPNQSTEEAYDTRNEIDQTMGTPNIFRGEQSKNNTLGQDERLIQQAGALQDDLAAAVDEAMQEYYRKLFQMMRVYYTEDHWFQVRGEDGKYDFVVMNADTMDTNIKVSVEAGSTLPANKQDIRQVAMDAAGAGRIDDLTFWEAVIYGKLPDPETIVERNTKQMNDPASFLNDVETQMFNREAATDIALIVAGKEPPVRDEYGQAYLEYFNKVIMGSKFIQFEQPVQEALKIHVAAAGATAARTANLGMTQVDDAAAAGMQEEEVQQIQ